MDTKIKAIPDGYHSITPYLIIDGASEAIAFYKKAFGAVEMLRIPGPDNKVGHAEIVVGNSRIMLADENPDMKSTSPKTLKGSPVTLLLYTEDVDAVFAQALAAGAKMTSPLQNMFYGDRSASVEDPFGHHWHLSTHIEDVSEEELNKRMAQLAKK